MTLTSMPVEDPEQLAQMFQKDPHTHIYGLADLEEPFWSKSEWFISGNAAVGKVTAGGEWVTGYAMSQRHHRENLALLAQVEGRLPNGTLVTGPLGLHDYVSRTRRSRSLGVHWRMVFDELRGDEGNEEIADLTPDDLDRVVELHGSAPGESFFIPSMLSHGVFVGVDRDGILIASAGTHVISDRYGVAAVGAVITHPEYRGLGLGRRVVIALCRRLIPRFPTIGLNVSDQNRAALRLYTQIGFEKVFDYEEVELG